MVEEAAEDGITGQDTAGTHWFIDASSHLKHAVAVACINDQIEYLRVRQAHTFSLELANYLEELIRAE